MNKDLYDSIGIGYTRTRSADPFLAEQIFSLLSPGRHSRALDVGCGTGNYTVALASRGYSFYGADPSRVMLEQAKRKSGSVFWVRAEAENLPFETGVFGAVLASLTIHHWKDPAKGFSEVSRVLENTGRFVILTADPEQMKGYWLNHYFPLMMRASMRVMPERKKIETALAAAGLTITGEKKYFIRPDLQDLFLYSGKQRPELYLDHRVRKGISSFAALAHRAEVEDGLEKLADDIKNCRFSRIARKYENDLGDYSLLVAAKN
jgi:SAM-dependent methyltransferase